MVAVCCEWKCRTMFFVVFIIIGRVGGRNGREGGYELGSYGLVWRESVSLIDFEMLADIPSRGEATGALIVGADNPTAVVKVVAKSHIQAQRFKLEK